jgi:hypothetical protein
MVVVFVEMARAPAIAWVAEARFKENRRALYMRDIVMDAVWAWPDSIHASFKPAL